jgi:tRNA-2-methylthio-N6-dimethylallyladenosine synthase
MKNQAVTKKKVLIRTFGCQMNERDSQIICGLLRAAGHILCESDKEADAVIFNTCSVRKHAEERVFSLIGEYKGKKIIGLVGCMAQNFKEKAFERDVRLDFVIGPQDIDKIPQALSRVVNDGMLEKKIWETDAESRPEGVYHLGGYEGKKHGYVIISEGCSNFCSYCIVPYVRGRIRHRSHKDILGEIEEAVAGGVKEVTLLGQNVNAYLSSADKKMDFVRLLELVNDVKGLNSFDFMTSHPKDASVSLLKAIASLDKLKKSLHLPVQSGSDRILKLMNRGYSRKEYLDLITGYRRIVKGATLTTDVILGFPTESEDDFKDTFDLVKAAGFDAAYIFKYSARPGTEAARLADDVPKKEKERRHALILDLQRNRARKKKASAIAAVFLSLSLFANVYASELERVKVAFLSRDYRLAISEGESLIGRDAYSGDLYYLLGLSYMKVGNFTRSQECFKEVIKDLKGSRLKEEASLGLADSLFLEGNFEAAKEAYQKLLKDNPKIKFKEHILSRINEIGSKMSAGPQYGINDSFYSVQVGSFSSIDNARKLTQKLIDSGYPAYTQAAVSLARETYRVRVGKLKTRAEAVELGKELAKEGHPVKICP